MVPGGVTIQHFNEEKRFAAWTQEGEGVSFSRTSPSVREKKRILSWAVGNKSLGKEGSNGGKRTLCKISAIRNPGSKP